MTGVHGAIAAGRRALAALGVSFLAASAVAAAAQTRDPLPIVAPLPAATVAPDRAAGVTGETFSLHPFISNALGSRRDVRAMATGGDGGAYIAHVPQAFGLTVKAPL